MKQSKQILVSTMTKLTRVLGTYAEFNGGREEIELLADLLLHSLTTGRVSGEVNERGHDDASLALQSLDDGVGELSTRVCH